MSLSADTGLIRDFAAACADHAERLQHAASSMVTAGAGPDAMFGAVGARFLDALNRAARDDAERISRLSGALALGRDAATGSAVAYGRADDAAADHIAGVGW